MEGFLDEIEVLLPVLGFDLLRRGSDVESRLQHGADKDPIFLFTQAGTLARAREAGGEFVESGSDARTLAKGSSCFGVVPTAFAIGRCLTDPRA